jgi:hypothetical protein
MKEQAQALAEARAAYGELADIYASQKREWEESVAELAGYVADAKAAMQAAEDALRGAGLAHYAANPGSKKLPFGLGVRVTQTLRYDEAKAFQWAQEHRIALALDKKAFERVAKASPLDFVTVEEVPTVTIPTDTIKLLEE